jgi:hypothetical protein
MAGFGRKMARNCSERENIMPIIDHKLGKFFGPSASYGGYVFIGCGIFASFYSLLSLTLLVPGFFMAYTYNGTLIDTDKKKIKSYTSLFGFIRTGNWINASQFKQFKIVNSRKRYSTYSRANVQFDMNISDIELLLTDSTVGKKIVLNKYSNVEDAQKEMKELYSILLP